MEATVEPLLAYWKANRQAGEAFGPFTKRVGEAELKRFTAAFHAMHHSQA